MIGMHHKLPKDREASSPEILRGGRNSKSIKENVKENENNRQTVKEIQTQEKGIIQHS